MLSQQGGHFPQRRRLMPCPASVVAEGRGMMACCGSPARAPEMAFLRGGTCESQTHEETSTNWCSFCFRWPIHSSYPFYPKRKRFPMLRIKNKRIVTTKAWCPPIARSVARLHGTLLLPTRFAQAGWFPSGFSPCNQKHTPVPCG